MVYSLVGYTKYSEYQLRQGGNYFERCTRAIQRLSSKRHIKTLGSMKQELMDSVETELNPIIEEQKHQSIAAFVGFAERDGRTNIIRPLEEWLCYSRIVSLKTFAIDCAYKLNDDPLNVETHFRVV